MTVFRTESLSLHPAAQGSRMPGKERCSLGAFWTIEYSKTEAQ
jgi:hypothetical protein